jgi:paraquat-inducible protein B
MGKKANPAVIGSFVLGAVVLAVAGLVVLGGGKLFRQTQSFVAYFDESVKGLAVGAPVMFKGVKVGTVTDIKVVVDQETVAVKMPVSFNIEADRFTSASGAPIHISASHDRGKILIDRGLRAQLELQSLVTGQLLIQLDFHPDKPVHLAGGPGEREIPTIPSSTERLAKALEQLPIDKISRTTLAAIEGIEKIVNNPDITRTLAELPATIETVRAIVRGVGTTVDRALGAATVTLGNVDTTLAAGRDAITDVQTAVRRVDSDVVPAAKDVLVDTRALVRNVDGRIEPLAAGAQKVLGAAVVALEDARKVLATVDDTVADGSPLHGELIVALRDLGAAARSLRALTDYVAVHPESLVFGKNANVDASPGGGR